jgi:hypothetical protein
MEAITEFQALKNFADNLNLTVHKYYSEDARKNVKYFIQKENITISPKLDFEQLNHFMLGYSVAIKQIN